MKEYRFSYKPERYSRMANTAIGVMTSGGLLMILGIMLLLSKNT